LSQTSAIVIRLCNNGICSDVTKGKEAHQLIKNKTKCKNKKKHITKN